MKINATKSENRQLYTLNGKFNTPLFITKEQTKKSV